MKKVLTGNQAVSWGVMCSRAQVVSAYPITPQTTIIEELAELVSDGVLDAKFIKVESEHSAMAGCIGAAAAGARAFTATSAQGLALMHELLHWAALGRLPIVMADVNRAMAPGWSIWTDQNDSLSQRDTGWLQFYCESNQELLDTVIQAYKISEAVLLPSMIVLDAFFLSHTLEAVEIPDAEGVEAFLPPWVAEYKLDVDNPRAFGGIVRPDIYQEFRYKQQEAMEDALWVAQEVDDEYGKRFGRRYGLIEEYKIDDAEIMLVTSATVTGTSRVVVDRMRDKGRKVGLLKIRLFRPFPLAEVRKVLMGVPKVAVIDRNICPGYGGIFAQEIKSALYGQSQNDHPRVFGFIAGLGGRDVKPEVIEEIIQYTEDHDRPEEDIIWIGVKK